MSRYDVGIIKLVPVQMPEKGIPCKGGFKVKHRSPIRQGSNVPGVAGHAVYKAQHSDVRGIGLFLPVVFLPDYLLPLTEESFISVGLAGLPVKDFPVAVGGADYLVRECEEPAEVFDKILVLHDYNVISHRKVLLPGSPSLSEFLCKERDTVS